MLKLTAKGAPAIESCEAREDRRLRQRGRKDKVELKRDTKDCKPQPVDLSQAANCDFIGAQPRARSA